MAIQRAAVCGLVVLCLLASHVMASSSEGMPGLGLRGRRLHNEQAHQRKLSQADVNAPMCPSTNAHLSFEDNPDSIFDHLTAIEAYTVAEKMTAEMGFIWPFGWSVEDGMPYEQEATTPTMFESYTHSVTLFPVPKTEALAYLDAGGPMPARYALVIAIRAGEAVPDIMEYKVGPLPLTSASNITEYRQLPFNKRPVHMGESEAVDVAVGEAALPLKDLFKEVTGGLCWQPDNTTDPECNGDSMTYFGYAGGLYEGPSGDHRVTVVSFYAVVKGEGMATELMNLPINFKLNHTGTNTSDWFGFGYEHCTQGFATAEELMTAFYAGNLTICKVPELFAPEYDPTWATLDKRGEREGSDRAGPRMYEPEGKRYTVTGAAAPNGRGFKWMGWEGYITVNPNTGIQLFDIKFDGERIAYELSLQEQYVAYSGYQTIGQCYYFDNYYTIGRYAYPLRPGYDCPETADYMDVTISTHRGVAERKGAVCMFEDDLASTAWRHTGYRTEGYELGLVRGTDFVVRSISTIGNYDYIYDIRFQLDGSIKVMVQMGGYMQTMYYDAAGATFEKDRFFGTRVHKSTFGNMHDHLSGWKVDLDVVGTANSFMKQTVKAGTYQQIFNEEPPPHASGREIFKYKQDEIIPFETAFKLNYDAPSVFQVINPDKTNAWGVPRGYSIAHGYTSSQLLPDDYPLTMAAAWTKYHLTIAQRKDSEPRSMFGVYDQHNPMTPSFSLDMVLDGETIEGADLVAWVTMGTQHVPRSEDVPLVTNHGAELWIKPWNYFDELRAMDIRDDDAFSTCIPGYGNTMFDYSWDLEGTNSNYNYTTGGVSSQSV